MTPDISNVPNNRILGNVIARLRRAAKLSQEELAHRADISPTYLSQLERGLKSPTLTVLTKLAKALDISASEILRAIEPKHKKP